MKKALITLIALAGVASAETTAYVNNELKNAITLSGYNTGDAFAMTFTITGHDSYGNNGVGNIITLDDSLYLMTQLGNFVGINTVSASNVSVENLKDSLTTDPSEKVHTLTMTGKATPAWLSYASDASGTQAYGIKNATFTISTDGTDSIVFIDYDGENEYSTKLVMTGYVLNANKLTLSEDGYNLAISDSTFVAGGNTYLIPEPATATLSLLALAGLAARRRRK